MAEVGTALAVVGLAGQILEGVQYLHSFFSNVKNAPEFVGSLDRELVCIQDILKNIRDRSINPSPGSQNDPLESALKNCAEPITLLQDLIKENDLQGPERGLRRQWNQICTGFKRKDFARYIDQLERAKTNLLNANVLKISDTQNQNLATAQETRQAVVELQSDHAIKAAADTESFSRLEDVSRQIHEIRTLVEQTAMSKIESIKQPHPSMVTAITAAINTAIQDALENHQKSIAGEIPIPHNLQYQVLGSSAQALKAEKLGSSRKRFQRWYSEDQRYKTWFGNLLIRRHEQYFSISQTFDVTKFEIYVLPSPWFLSKGFMATLEYLGKESVKPSPKLVFEPIRVVRNDSPVFEACRRGDIRTVGRLFKDGQASIYDRNESGFNLLESTIEAVVWEGKSSDPEKVPELIRFLLGWDSGLEINSELETRLNFTLRIRDDDDLFRCWKILFSTSKIDLNSVSMCALLGIMLDNPNSDHLHTVTCHFDFMTNWNSIIYYGVFGYWVISDVFGFNLREYQTSEDADSGADYQLKSNEQVELDIQGTSLALEYLFASGLRTSEIMVGHNDLDPFHPSRLHHWRRHHWRRQFSLLAFAFTSGAKAMTDFFDETTWEFRDGRHNLIEEWVIRIMTIILKHGASPDGRLPGNKGFADYRWSESFSPTDMARDLDMLEIWREALVRSGFDADSIIDESVYSGFVDLFDGLVYQEPKIQKKIYKKNTVPTEKESLLKKTLRVGLTVVSSIV